MKTKITFALMLLSAFFLSLPGYAKIWRVNNQSNYNNTTLWGQNYGGTTTYPVFKQINQAIAWAGLIAGDTIHVEGSTAIYETATITKKVVIIGPGYFLAENPKVFNTTYDARLGRINFNVGSQDSQLIGMNMIPDGSSPGVYINTDGITIKRCRIERRIFLASGLADVYILQNFFVGNSTTDYNALVQNGSSPVPPNEIIFNNNICENKLIWQRSDSEIWNILECNNNVFAGPANSLNLKFNTGSFRNNILKSNNMTAVINQGTNNNVSHNTSATTDLFSGTPGNLLVPSMASLFVNSGTTDGLYQLQPGVSGNIAGIDGAERGAFGGIAPSNRYTLSGLAAIPVVYDVTTSGVSQPGTGLTVEIKARTIK